jgi:hypothetical protein
MTFSASETIRDRAHLQLIADSVKPSGRECHCPGTDRMSCQIKENASVILEGCSNCTAQTRMDENTDNSDPR